MSISDDIFGTLREVAGVLESLGVEWAVGGSFASSAHGEPRATNDIDVTQQARLGELLQTGLR